MVNAVVCALCNKQVSSKNFARHVANVHTSVKIKSEEYYKIRKTPQSMTSTQANPLDDVKTS